MQDFTIGIEKIDNEAKRLLQPCIDVIYGGDYYRITLSKVVESYLKGRYTHCREIGRETNIHPNLVNEALKMLEKCGYVEALEHEAAPKKGVRKPYKPTPLGVVMYAILTLPHIKGRETGGERKNAKENYAYAVACWLAEDFVPLLKDIYLQAYSQKPSRQAEIEKGYKTALHAIDLLCMRAGEIRGNPTGYGDLVKDLDKTLLFLNLVKEMSPPWCLSSVVNVVKKLREEEIHEVVNVCLEEVYYLEGILNSLKTLLRLDHSSRQERLRSLITA